MDAMRELITVEQFTRIVWAVTGSWLVIGGLGGIGGWDCGVGIGPGLLIDGADRWGGALG